jgi:hypothetical protein
MNKGKLIDHTIIYNNKENHFFKPENKTINFPLFPNLKNIIFQYNNANQKENLDLIKEKSFSLSTIANSENLDKPKEILKNDIQITNEKLKDENKIVNKDFLNKKRKGEAEKNSSSISNMSSDKIVKKIRIMILN